MLLVNILKNTDKVAFGIVVLREREKLEASSSTSISKGYYREYIALSWRNKADDEIKEISASATNKVKLEEQELVLGKILVKQLRSERFDISSYSDAYTKELEKLIQAKNQGKLHIVKKEEPKETTKDLLEALKASVSRSVLVQNQNTNNNNQKQYTTNHVTKRVQRKEEF